MSKRGMSGFTLVELLVVILIIGILASLLLPALIYVINVARQAGQEGMMDSIVQGLTNYEQSTMKLPPGDGRGSRELVKALREPGPKKEPYMEIREDVLSPDGDFLDLVHKDSPRPLSVVHYRNNRGRKPGPDGIGRPGISPLRAYDLWCAGMDYDPQRPDSAWMIHRP